MVRRRQRPPDPRPGARQSPRDGRRGSSLLSQLAGMTGDVLHSAAVSVSEYRYRRRVQFADTDVAGVVHFSWIARYMEEAEHALWREAGLSIAPRDQPVGFP